MLNWQFYNQNVVKCKETSSTQNNVDETEEQKDFRVEKIDIAKETTDGGTSKEIVQKRKRSHQQSKKQLKKIQEKKLNLMADLKENQRKINQIKSK